jgi:hypothetical protein
MIFSKASIKKGQIVINKGKKDVEGQTSKGE